MEPVMTLPQDSQLKHMARDCACLNVRRAARAITELYDEALAPSGVRITQFPLLIAIAVSGSATLTDLARALGMDRTTLSRSLKPLERQGLIAVVPGQDRRTRTVVLTTAGRDALARALPLWERVQGRVMEQLGQARWQDILGGLAAIEALGPAV
jgi:DNA-binding MarR family transcriptional regulator